MCVYVAMDIGVHERVIFHVTKKPKIYFVFLPNKNYGLTSLNKKKMIFISKKNIYSPHTISLSLFLLSACT